VLPDAIADAVCRALDERGLGRRVERVESVGGGCINHGARLETDAGASVFLKWNAAAPPGMFEAEADGLEALADAGTLRVPAPLAWSDGAHAGAAGEDGHETSVSWLLMEHVPAGRASGAVDERLGAGLAALHASAEGDGFGWARDNWIGSLPQANEPSSSWADFWRERRLAPQLERARARGHLKDAALDRVLDLCPAALADVERPHLLHGDLWGGNWFAAEGGEPVLIDPAVYRGHGEVDLAMSELFGGFAPGFYDAYREARGITSAYGAYRRDLYQLYYLLAHVNLFGAGYEAGSLRAARRVVAALSG